MADVEVTITLPELAARNLAVLAERHGTGAVAEVLLTLADHAQQGVYRPGAWERDWVIQAFGEDWLSRIEPDTDRLSADGRVVFARPVTPQ